MHVNHSHHKFAFIILITRIDSYNNAQDMLKHSDNIFYEYDLKFFTFGLDLVNYVTKGIRNMPYS